MKRKNRTLITVLGSILLSLAGVKYALSQTVAEPPKYVSADSISIRKVDLNGDGKYEGIISIEGQNYTIERYDDEEFIFSPYYLSLPADTARTDSTQTDSTNTLDSKLTE